MAHAVLVPLDGSALAERVLPLARGLARATGRDLLLARVIPAVDARLYSSAELAAFVARAQRAERRRAQLRLDLLADDIARDGLTARVLVQTGEPGTLLTALATPAEVDLVVMSTHGEGGIAAIVFGSVTDQVLRVSRVPVLLASIWAQVAWPVAQTPRALVALDGSPRAEHAIEAALRVLHPVSPELLLLSVADPDAAGATEAYLASVAGPLRGQGMAVETYVTHGSPAARIADAATELDADLIAMGTHGRTGLVRLVLGSVAAESVRRAEVPVLLAPHRRG